MSTWLDEDPVTITTEGIAEWLAAGEWAPSSRATYHGHLCAWFEWLLRNGHRLDDPMVGIGSPKRPRSQPHPVADEHMPRLLATPMWPRTLVMILLASLAGLRVHEIAKVKGEDVDIIGKTLRVTGKGHVTATIPLHPVLVDAAKTMPRSGWWFPSATKPGRPVLGQSVSIRIREVMTRAGVPGSAHSLRHWFGTTLVDSGADLRVAQELLRHASLATTQIYVRAADHRKVEGIARLDLYRTETERRPA